MLTGGWSCPSASITDDSPGCCSEPRIQHITFHPVPSLPALFLTKTILRLAGRLWYIKFTKYIPIILVNRVSKNGDIPLCLIKALIVEKVFIVSDIWILQIAKLCQPIFERHDAHPGVMRIRG